VTAKNREPSMDMAEMQKHASDAAELLKKMANEHRLLVLCTLMAGELSVGELNQRIALSQSALSQHLTALRKADLVRTRRQSQTIYYRLHGDNAIRIIAVLQSIYCPEL